MQQAGRWVWVGVVALVAVACASVSPRSFERTVQDAEKHADTYTDKDWKRADAAFREFVKKYNIEYVLTLDEEQQREVGRLVARYAKVRMLSVGGQLKKTMHTGVSLLQGIVEELGVQVEAADGGEPQERNVGQTAQ